MRGVSWLSGNDLAQWESTSLGDLHTWLQILIPPLLNQFLSNLVNLDWLPNIWTIFLSMGYPPCEHSFLGSTTRCEHLRKDSVVIVLYTEFNDAWH